MKLTNEIKEYMRDVLLPYIQDSLSKGFTKEEIYSTLLDAGHDKDIIELCFQVLENKVDLNAINAWPKEEILEELNSDHIQHLKHFIETHLNRGYKIDEIKAILIQMGESEDEIKKAIDSLDLKENNKNQQKDEQKEENKEKPLELDEVNKVKYSLRWTSEQKYFFFTNVGLWIVLILLFSISLGIQFALPGIAFLPIMLYPILDLFLKRRAFIAISVLISLLFPLILLFYHYHPSIEVLFFINLIFFLIYYDAMYLGFYRKVFKK